MTDDAEDHGDTFDHAAVLFARLQPALWDPLGRRLLDLAAPEPGERLLDVCCGTGASAVPAARAVGPGGAVDAVDVSAGMLDVARAAVGDELPWLRFAHADATSWTGGPYDVAVSGYGVFFLPDMDAACRRLVGLLRPGGRFAVSAWRQGAVVPFMACLAGAIEDVRGPRPARGGGGPPWARLHTESALTSWLASIGLTDVRAVEVEHAVPLDDGAAWDLVLGTGARALLDGVPEEDHDRVRARLLARLADAGITEFDATSVVGVGSRPDGVSGTPTRPSAPGR